MIDIKELKALGEAGFIPGPGESEGDFLSRVATLRALSGKPHPFLKEGECDSLVADYPHLGATPDWIPQVYSNRRLLPWQGAIFWVFTTPEGVRFPLVQLRKGFKKGRFLGYDREEVIAHEVSHALRLAFNEPRFEEMLAYFHAKKKWRRFLGPLFARPRHALFFVALIFVCMGMQMALPFFLDSPLLPYLEMGACLPLTAIFIHAVLGMRDRWVFYKALRALKLLFPKQRDPFVVALRLKDAEIQQFARKSLEETLLYIKEKSLSSIRWQQILAQFS